MAATDFVTESQVDSLVTNVATAVKANSTAIATKANTSALTAHTSAATGAHAASAISILDTGLKYTAIDVEAALAEVKTIADAAAGGGVTINDAATNGTQAWSSTKISSHVSAAVASLVSGSPAALDTLNELAVALGSDASFATTMSTALGLRVRVDAAQAFTGPQQSQGKANLGIVASVVNFAGNFNTGIA